MKTVWSEDTTPLAFSTRDNDLHYNLFMLVQLRLKTRDERFTFKFIYACSIKIQERKLAHFTLRFRPVSIAVSCLRRNGQQNLVSVENNISTRF